MRKFIFVVSAIVFSFVLGRLTAQDLMIRVDPDKVVPLMDEAASRVYLANRK